MTRQTCPVATAIRTTRTILEGAEGGRRRLRPGVGRTTRRLDEDGTAMTARLGNAEIPLRRHRDGTGMILRPREATGRLRLDVRLRPRDAEIAGMIRLLVEGGILRLLPGLPRVVELDLMTLRRLLLDEDTRMPGRPSRQGGGGTTTARPGGTGTIRRRDDGNVSPGC